MNFAEHKIRMRRYLRDPDGTIWNDTFLKNMFNVAQTNFENIVDQLEDIQILRIPPLYQMSYMYDWEWRYTEHEKGQVYRVFEDAGFYDQSDIVTTYKWEAQQEAGSESTLSELGMRFTHPWEAWQGELPADNPPIWLPENFREMLFIAFNKDPISPATKKETMDMDRTWKNRGGTAMFYFRDDKLENHIKIYPLPSSVAWADPIGDAESGMVLDASIGTASSNRGTIIDITGAYANSNRGITIDVVDIDDNLFCVFRKRPKEIISDSDISEFPRYLTKYIEYDALERAYSANTDGHIESLKNYWGWRKKLGQKIVKRFNSKRRSDRVYRLRTKSVPPQRTQRHARLPDTYPAVGHGYEY